MVGAAKELAAQLVKDQIDVAIFDATQADPIAAVVANWDVARVKINLCRRTPLFAGGINCISYTDQAKYRSGQGLLAASWRRQPTSSSKESTSTKTSALPRSAAPTASRSSAIVLATSGQDLDKTISEEFVENDHQHPAFAPAGDLPAVSAKANWPGRSGKFESAGVGKRVGYAGRRKDLPGFLRIADLYLAELPNAQRRRAFCRR